MGNKFPTLRLSVSAIKRQPENGKSPFQAAFVCCLIRNRVLITLHRRNNFYIAVVEGIQRTAVSDADDDALRQALAD